MEHFRTDEDQEFIALFRAFADLNTPNSDEKCLSSPALKRLLRAFYGVKLNEPHFLELLTLVSDIPDTAYTKNPDNKNQPELMLLELVKESECHLDTAERREGTPSTGPGLSLESFIRFFPKIQWQIMQREVESRRKKIAKQRQRKEDNDILEQSMSQSRGSSGSSSVATAEFADVTVFPITLADQEIQDYKIRSLKQQEEQFREKMYLQDENTKMLRKSDLKANIAYSQNVLSGKIIDIDQSSLGGSDSPTTKFKSPNFGGSSLSPSPTKNSQTLTESQQTLTNTQTHITEEELQYQAQGPQKTKSLGSALITLRPPQDVTTPQIKAHPVESYKQLAVAKKLQKEEFNEDGTGYLLDEIASGANFKPGSQGNLNQSNRWIDLDQLSGSKPKMKSLAENRDFGEEWKPREILTGTEWFDYATMEDTELLDNLTCQTMEELRGIRELVGPKHNEQQGDSSGQGQGQGQYIDSKGNLQKTDYETKIKSLPTWTEKDLKKFLKTGKKDVHKNLSTFVSEYGLKNSDHEKTTAIAEKLFKEKIPVHKIPNLLRSDAFILDFLKQIVRAEHLNQVEALGGGYSPEANARQEAYQREKQMNDSYLYRRAGVEEGLQMEQELEEGGSPLSMGHFQQGHSGGQFESSQTTTAVKDSLSQSEQNHYNYPGPGIKADGVKFPPRDPPKADAEPKSLLRKYRLTGPDRIINPDTVSIAQFWRRRYAWTVTKSEYPLGRQDLTLVITTLWNAHDSRKRKIKQQRQKLKKLRAIKYGGGNYADFQAQHIGSADEYVGGFLARRMREERMQEQGYKKRKKRSKGQQDSPEKLIFDNNLNFLKEGKHNKTINLEETIETLESQTVSPGKSSDEAEKSLESPQKELDDAKSQIENQRERAVFKAKKKAERELMRGGDIGVDVVMKGEGQQGNGTSDGLKGVDSDSEEGAEDLDSQKDGRQIQQQTQSQFPGDKQDANHQQQHPENLEYEDSSSSDSDSQETTSQTLPHLLKRLTIKIMVDELLGPSHSICSWAHFKEKFPSLWRNRKNWLMISFLPQQIITKNPKTLEDEVTGHTMVISEKKMLDRVQVLPVLDALFDFYDKDRDGYITDREAVNLFSYVWSMNRRTLIAGSMINNNKNSQGVQAQTNLNMELPRYVLEFLLHSCGAVSTWGDRMPVFGAPLSATSLALGIQDPSQQGQQNSNLRQHRYSYTISRLDYLRNFPKLYENVHKWGSLVMADELSKGQLRWYWDLFALKDETEEEDKKQQHPAARNADLLDKVDGYDSVQDSEDSSSSSSSESGDSSSSGNSSENKFNQSQAKLNARTESKLKKSKGSGFTDWSTIDRILRRVVLNYLSFRSLQVDNEWEKIVTEAEIRKEAVFQQQEYKKNIQQKGLDCRKQQAEETLDRNQFLLRRQGHKSIDISDRERGSRVVIGSELTAISSIPKMYYPGDKGEESGSSGSVSIDQDDIEAERQKKELALKKQLGIPPDEDIPAGFPPVQPDANAVRLESEAILNQVDNLHNTNSNQYSSVSQSLQARILRDQTTKGVQRRHNLAHRGELNALELDLFIERLIGVIKSEVGSSVLTKKSSTSNEREQLKSYGKVSWKHFSAAFFRHWKKQKIVLTDQFLGGTGKALVSEQVISQNALQKNLGVSRDTNENEKDKTGAALGSRLKQQDEVYRDEFSEKYGFDAHRIPAGLEMFVSGRERQDEKKIERERAAAAATGVDQHQQNRQKQKQQQQADAQQQTNNANLRRGINDAALLALSGPTPTTLTPGLVAYLVSRHRSNPRDTHIHDDQFRKVIIEIYRFVDPTSYLPPPVKLVMIFEEICQDVWYKIPDKTQRGGGNSKPNKGGTSNMFVEGSHQASDPASFNSPSNLLGANKVTEFVNAHSPLGPLGPIPSQKVHSPGQFSSNMMSDVDPNSPIRDSYAVAKDDDDDYYPDSPPGARTHHPSVLKRWYNVKLLVSMLPWLWGERTKLQILANSCRFERLKSIVVLVPSEAVRLMTYHVNCMYLLLCSEGDLLYGDSNNEKGQNNKGKEYGLKTGAKGGVQSVDKDQFKMEQELLNTHLPVVSNPFEHEIGTKTGTNSLDITNYGNNVNSGNDQLQGSPSAHVDPSTGKPYAEVFLPNFYFLGLKRPQDLDLFTLGTEGDQQLNKFGKKNINMGQHKSLDHHQRNKCLDGGDKEKAAFRYGNSSALDPEVAVKREFERNELEKAKMERLMNVKLSLEREQASQSENLKLSLLKNPQEPAFVLPLVMLVEGFSLSRKYRNSAGKSSNSSCAPRFAAILFLHGEPALRFSHRQLKLGQEYLASQTAPEKRDQVLSRTLTKSQKEIVECLPTLPLLFFQRERQYIDRQALDFFYAKMQLVGQRLMEGRMAQEWGGKACMVTDEQGQFTQYQRWAERRSEKRQRQSGFYFSAMDRVADIQEEGSDTDLVKEEEGDDPDRFLDQDNARGSSRHSFVTKGASESGQKLDSKMLMNLLGLDYLDPSCRRSFGALMRVQCGDYEGIVGGKILGEASDDQGTNQSLDPFFLVHPQDEVFLPENPSCQIRMACDLNPSIPQNSASTKSNSIRVRFESPPFLLYSMLRTGAAAAEIPLFDKDETECTGASASDIEAMSAPGTRAAGHIRIRLVVNPDSGGETVENLKEEWGRLRSRGGGRA